MYVYVCYIQVVTYIDIHIYESQSLIFLFWNGRYRTKHVVQENTSENL